MFTVPDGATSFIKFKIKSDIVAKRTLKLGFHDFVLYEVAKKGTNFTTHVLQNCFSHLIFCFVTFSLLSSSWFS